MKTIWKILIGILAVLGILFLVFMFLPDDEEDYDVAYDTPSTEASVNVRPEGKVESEGAGSLSASEIKPVDVNTGAESATIMIYMNGSDLEAESGEATDDISEMLRSGIGDKVNVVIQTMGTKKWMDYGISSSTAQRYIIKNKKLELVEDKLGQLDSTASDTLSDFISFSKNNYPADRFMLIFWNHGGGPVYGFGYDQFQDENASLTVAEIKSALSKNGDIKFDIIGMDCCIMSTIETAYVLGKYCDYTILSEDFESGLGWEYTTWMKLFEEYPGISSPLLGKSIVDSMIKANETLEEGDTATLALIKSEITDALFDAWINFAYDHEKELLGTNYSKSHKARGRSDWIFSLWDDDESDVTLSEYNISDVLALVESTGGNDDTSEKLSAALKAAIAYYGRTDDASELTGMSVTLPYGDDEYYNDLRDVFSDCDIDSGYIEWLSKFVDAEGSDSYYDYDDFEDSWSGWGSYYDEYEYDCDDEYYTEEWQYDYEEQLWYFYDEDGLYLYDEEENIMYYYDDTEDEYYYYDEHNDEWYLCE